MMTRALLTWVALLCTAVVNGAAREGWLAPRLGAPAAHIISTLLLSVAILVASWLAIEWVAPATLGGAVAVGTLWLALTLAFEFGAGHYLFGTPWNVLFADYDVASGRIWPLVLMTTFAAPPLCGLARGAFAW